MKVLLPRRSLRSPRTAWLAALLGAATGTACGTASCPPGTFQEGTLCKRMSSVTAGEGNAVSQEPNLDTGRTGSGSNTSNGGTANSGLPNSAGTANPGGPGSNSGATGGTSGSTPNGSMPTKSVPGAGASASPGVCAPGSTPSPEVCDNADNDCDGMIDETVEKACGSSSRLPCRMGKQTCTAGLWGPCVGAVEPMAETCDPGKQDENCDGNANEGCMCTPGESMPCGDKGGTCKPGTQTCTASGTWATECIGAIKPQTEICDGKLDEDCDGLTDSDDPDCECINNSSQECIGGNGKGICAAGMQTCSNGKWGACKGPSPKKEVCDGQPIDEDCDGSANNGCDCENGMEQSCIDPSNACSHGTQTCSNGKWSSCAITTRCSSTEMCVGDVCKPRCNQTQCQATGNTCQPKRCNQSTGACENATPSPRSTACSDGSVQIGYCENGSCQPDREVLCRSNGGSLTSQWTLNINGTGTDATISGEFGSCETKQSHRPVVWTLMDGGNGSGAPITGLATVRVTGRDHACDSSGQNCRVWFASPETRDEHAKINCSIFDDGGANPANDTNMWVPSPNGMGHPSGGEKGATMCTPGTCRKWIGRCTVQ